MWEPSNWRHSRAAVCAGRLAGPDFQIPVPQPRVTLVYSAEFFGAVHEEQVQLVYAQVDSLFHVGLLTAENVDVHVVLSHGTELLAWTANSGPLLSLTPTGVFNHVTQRVRQYSSRAQVFYHYESADDFFGLHHIWTLSHQHSDHYFAYFHNEGAMLPKYPSTRRTALEMALFREVIAPWRAVLRILQHFNGSVQHLSLAPGVVRFVDSSRTVRLGGFHWFNFWWARGQYLAARAEPARRPHRGDHDLWLARRAQEHTPHRWDPHDFFMGGPGCNQAYSLKACNIGACIEKDSVAIQVAAYERLLIRSLGIPMDVLEPSNWGRSRATFCARQLPVKPQNVTPVNATIVYSATFVGFVHEEQVQLVYAQIDSLFNVGLFTSDNVEVHVVLAHGKELTKWQANSGPISHLNPADVFDDVTRRIRQYTANARIFYHYENRFEYFGLHHAWSLAHKDPQRYYAYFHNKGATRPKFPNARRTALEMLLFREVIAPWRSVLRIFEHYHDSVQHLSFAPAFGGFHWYNFWWASGWYLSSRVEPVSSANRHDYECWLGQAAKSDTAECWGNNGNIYATAKTACSNAAYSLQACRAGKCLTGLRTSKNEMSYLSTLVGAIHGDLG